MENKRCKRSKKANLEVQYCWWFSIAVLKLLQFLCGYSFPAVSVNSLQLLQQLQFSWGHCSFPAGTVAAVVSLELLQLLCSDCSNCSFTGVTVVSLQLLQQLQFPQKNVLYYCYYFPTVIQNLIRLNFVNCIYIVLNNLNQKISSYYCQAKNGLAMIHINDFQAFFEYIVQ